MTVASQESLLGLGINSTDHPVGTCIKWKFKGRGRETTSVVKEWVAPGRLVILKSSKGEGTYSPVNIHVTQLVSKPE